MIRYIMQVIGAENFKTRLVAAMLESGWKLLLQVHDELLISVPKKDLRKAHEILRTTMESVEFDIPILTEGEWSDKDWSSMIEFDKRGVVTYKANSEKVLA
jgi:DNA polymerase I-like protein with 3'-5' exonuclease and polymerase domains